MMGMKFFWMLYLIYALCSFWFENILQVLKGHEISICRKLNLLRRRKIGLLLLQWMLRSAGPRLDCQRKFPSCRGLLSSGLASFLMFYTLVHCSATLLLVISVAWLRLHDSWFYNDIVSASGSKKLVNIAEKECSNHSCWSNFPI